MTTYLPSIIRPRLVLLAAALLGTAWLLHRLESFARALGA